MTRWYAHRDMTPLCVRHDSFIHVTWLLYVCDMTPLRVRHDSFIHVTWLIHIRDMTHSDMRHDSFTYSWLIHIRDMTHLYMSQDSCIYVTWLVDIHDTLSFFFFTRPTHVCEVPRLHATEWTLSVRYLYVGHDSWIYVTWFIHMYVWDMTRWHRDFISSISLCRTWLVDICDMIHSYVCVGHDSLI